MSFADINKAKADELLVQCRAQALRHQPRFYEVDLVDISALREAIGAAIHDLGGITVLVDKRRQRRRTGGMR